MADTEVKNNILNWKRLIVTTLLVVVASALTSSITWFFLNNLFNESQNANLVLIKQLEKEITFLGKQYTTNCGSSVPVGTDANSGSITGSVTYPSEAIPTDVKVVAVSADTNKTYDAQIVFTGNAASYTAVVPAGNYYIYGTSSHQGSKKAYYDKFITCGMSVNCTDTSKIAVTVTAGKTTANITVGDFWNAE